ncbi:MAG: phage portal protein [Pirellulales bacterium]
MIDFNRSKTWSGRSLKGARWQYDAVESRGKRRQPAVRLAAEDDILTASKRRIANANTLDLNRNLSLFGWAVRRHLDYVTSFEFHPQGKDPGLKRELTDFFWRIAARQRIDAQGRQSWAGMFRMLEAQAVLAGDDGLLIYDDGSTQGMEGGRVVDPPNVEQRGGRWVQGVKINDKGRHLAYAIHNRVGNRLEFSKTVSASNMIWHGYYDRWDQTRGISPILSAVNPLRDAYENFDYALQTAKVRSLLTFAFFRKSGGAIGEPMPGAGQPTTDGQGQTKRTPYQVNFGEGPVIIDLDPDDDAKFLESNSPGMSFQEFMKLDIMVALKALDIPFSFFDEAHTNFFGSRGSWLHYERACLARREPLQDAQDRLFLRNLLIAIRDGDFDLPRAGMSALQWEFVPRGIPWWKPSEEVRGDLDACAAGIDNLESVCLKRGTGSVYENIDKNAAVIEYAKNKGITLVLGGQPVQTKIEVSTDDN